MSDVAVIAKVVLNILDYFQDKNLLVDEEMVDAATKLRKMTVDRAHAAASKPNPDSIVRPITDIDGGVKRDKAK